MKQVVRNVRIIGTGSYTPEKMYTNEYLESILPTNAQWIYNNVGIKERRIAADNWLPAICNTGRFACHRKCRTDVKDIDLIIVATATLDRKHLPWLLYNIN